jgi:hypothetical protein
VAIIELALWFLIIPLLTALVTTGHAGKKLGWAVMAGIASFLADGILTALIGGAGGLLGAIAGGTVMILIAATTSKPSTKQCPDCAERINAEARKSRYCGRLFSDPVS